MAHDNDVLLVHDDRLAEAELPNRGGHRIDGGVIHTGIIFIRFDGAKRAHFDVHWAAGLLISVRFVDRTSCSVSALTGILADSCTDAREFMITPVSGATALRRNEVPKFLHR